MNPLDNASSKSIISTFFNKAICCSIRLVKFISASMPSF